MMKKLVGNAVSVLIEVFMWVTVIVCAIGGLYLGFSVANLGVIGAVGGLVLGVIAGILLNTVWWLISVVVEIRDYSKKWLGKTEPGLPAPAREQGSPAQAQEPGFQSAGSGRKIIISLVSLVLLAGIIVIAKNFAGSDAGEKNTAYKDEKEDAEFAEEAEEPTEPSGFKAESPAFKIVKMPDGKAWMAENLNIETGNSACYNDEPENCRKCGRLYDWSSASTACPKGWHLPSDAEWAGLGNAIGNSSGTALRSKSGWNNDNNGTDDYGFTALPCGRYFDGKFLHYGALAFFWTATESDSKNALGSALDANNANLDIGKISKSYKRSVRCIQD